MPLSIGKLKVELYNAFKEADAESARDLGLSTVETPQKSRERLRMAEAIAETIINHIRDNADVIVPNHEPGGPAALPATDVAAGPGGHIHTITVPTRHDIGSIK